MVSRKHLVSITNNKFILRMIYYAFLIIVLTDASETLGRPLGFPISKTGTTIKRFPCSLLLITIIDIRLKCAIDN